MANIAALSNGACRLLLRLVELGGEYESRDDLMERSGITSRSEFFKARKQLIQAGMLDERGMVNFIVANSIARRPDPRSFAVQSIAAQPVVVSSESEHWPPVAEPVVISGGLREQSMRADLMPHDGNPTQPGSNFQARRRAQIAVLVAVFKDLFDYNLSPDKAKELLVLSGDSAEEILDAAETTKAQPKEIKYPVGYIKSILKRREQEADEEDDNTAPSKDFYISQPSERTARVTAILAERGLLDDDDDDY